MRAGRAIASETRCRGFNESYGFWNTIWIRQRATRGLRLAVSSFVVARTAALTFVAQGAGGSIVFTASVLAFQGRWTVSSYAASKAGVANLARARQTSGRRWGSA